MDLTQRIPNRPVKYISFHDFKEVGFDITVSELEKKLDNGHVKTSVKVQEVRKKGSKMSRDVMQEILWVYGIDTRNQRFWVTPKKKHRAFFTNEPVYDYRYMGYERLDKEWINSGRASIEAITISSRMSDMGEVLSEMSNGGERDE